MKRIAALIEVMGRDCGYLALMAGIARGAEGARYNAEAMASHLRQHREEIGFDLRVTTLGHVRRGGNPSTPSQAALSSGHPHRPFPLYRPFPSVVALVS